MDDAYWSSVTATRLAVIGLLESLTEAEWNAPSLCRDWRVRDVAGHLSVVPTVTTWQLAATVPQARFDLNRANTILARRAGSHPPGEILESLRAHAADQHTARVLDTRDALFDVIVHSQDIARPLGRTVEVPADLTARGLQRVWEMGWPFRAKRRFAAVTLRATDTDWTVGSGPEISGPALALLLLTTGRGSAALGSLSGRGLAALPA